MARLFGAEPASNSSSKSISWFTSNQVIVVSALSRRLNWNQWTVTRQRADDIQHELSAYSAPGCLFNCLSFRSLAVIGYRFSHLGISAQINKSEGKYYALTFQKLVGLDFLNFLKPRRWLCEHFCEQRLPSYSLRQFQEVALRAFLWRLVGGTRTFQTPNNYT